ncbi:MAG: ABC transporter ATPase [Bacteroidota bacterium]|nr:ABC transporter ATPase [Bacteroidota bacterium]
MFVKFDQLPDNSRIWIYQANRKFSPVEINEIEVLLSDFIQQWTVHGSALRASYTIKYDRFIIIAVDQQYAQVSGCSIDSSVRFIQMLEQKYNVDLLDKMNVTFRTGEFIAHKTLLEFKQMVKTKAVNAETIVFNNLVDTKADLEGYWEVPAKESWHTRFF